MHSQVPKFGTEWFNMNRYSVVPLKVPSSVPNPTEDPIGIVQFLLLQMNRIFEGLNMLENS